MSRPKQRYAVALGEDVTVPCVASGNPKPDILWSKIGTNAEMDSEHGCLAITDAKETDGGSYMCAIYNGSRRFLRRTTIVVKTPPVFTKVPEGAEVDAGAQLFLHCQVMSCII